ncbi:ribosome maturation factor RimM [Acidicapsa dinghuensis]|uniref:Ribosome maturation factor RimM n=1 Tax=Acidicapsa dinghuensis TaxID=2218256 RepID=A0ABW1EDN7_9BACT|nr:ribosome maturation factor RimM [Acidicapsa dinghuensis]
MGGAVCCVPGCDGAMTSEPQQMDAWVWLARIRRAQGRKGEVLAEVLTDFPEKFAERKRVWLLPGEGGRVSGAKGLTGVGRPREVELVSYWMHKAGQTGDVVLHFAGVNSISEADELRGLIVAIPRGERAALGEDEVYVGDLIGCRLVDVFGGMERVIGEIEDVDRESGPVALLVVKGAGYGEILVPFAKAYLRRIDLDAKRVEMALPEGLVELNAS